jgi:DNA-binding HxlR family transcriptional regulator
MVTLRTNGESALSQMAHEALAQIQRSNLFSEDCPAHKAIDCVANKWAVLVIYALSQGQKRHHELKKLIPASTKVLVSVLRRLEKNGLVGREVQAAVPPIVEYRLTPLGISLVEPLAVLCRWAEIHLDELADIQTKTTRKGAAP